VAEQIFFIWSAEVGKKINQKRSGLRPKIHFFQFFLSLWLQRLSKNHTSKTSKFFASNAQVHPIKGGRLFSKRPLTSSYYQSALKSPRGRGSGVKINQNEQIMRNKANFRKAKKGYNRSVHNN